MTAREPLRLVGPFGMRCDCPECQLARAYGHLAPHGAGRVRYRTPEDGQTVATPEAGQPIITRESASRREVPARADDRAPQGKD